MSIRNLPESSISGLTPQTNVIVPITYLVVAGGGGGGNTTDTPGGGGGGAGGLLTASDIPMTKLTVTVGAGGAADAVGNNSVCVQTAIGGGEGSNKQSGVKFGGSGAGGGYANEPGGVAVYQQGSTGGTGNGTAQAGGGGGGAGAVGSNSSTSTTGNGGAGGAGLSNSTSGSAATYAGGGGGGSASTSRWRPACAPMADPTPPYCANCRYSAKGMWWQRGRFEFQITASRLLISSMRVARIVPSAMLTAKATLALFWDSRSNSAGVSTQTLQSL